MCDAVMVYLTANVTSAVTQKAPVDPGGVLPQDLQDWRPGPFEHSVEIRDTERPTYYWTFRLITNLVMTGRCCCCCCESLSCSASAAGAVS